jgi:hypothetical protein
MNEINIVSLDLETSGLDVGFHVPLSIGAVKLDLLSNGYNSENSFYVQLEWDSAQIDPKALKVNKLDIVNPPGKTGMLHCNSLPSAEGIEAFKTWLNNTPRPYDEKIVALGKNVGSFDLPMLRSVWNHGWNRDWPFHYRSIDINTLLFTVCEITGSSFVDISRAVSERAWGLQRRLFEDVQITHMPPHHALADAWWNVFARRECMVYFGHKLQEIKGSK